MTPDERIEQIRNARINDYIESQGYTLKGTSFCAIPEGPDEYSCFLCQDHVVHMQGAEGYYMIDMVRHVPGLSQHCSSYYIAVNICPECEEKLYEELDRAGLGPLDEEKAIQKTINIQHHINTGHFPENSDLYTQNRLNSGKCVYCDSFVSSKGEDYQESYRPMGLTQVIEGPVKICIPCDMVHDYLSGVQSVYFDNIEEYYDRSEVAEIDECPSCKERYLITKEEQNVRFNDETKHLCYRCLNNKHNLMNTNRFVDITCSECGTVYLRDLTLPYVANQLSNAYDKFVCNPCLLHGKQGGKEEKNLFDQFINTGGMEAPDVILIKERIRLIIRDNAKDCPHKRYTVLLTDEGLDKKEEGEYVLERESSSVEACTGTPESCKCYASKNEAVNKGTLAALKYIQKNPR